MALSRTHRRATVQRLAKNKALLQCGKKFSIMLMWLRFCKELSLQAYRGCVLPCTGIAMLYHATVRDAQIETLPYLLAGIYHSKDLRLGGIAVESGHQLWQRNPA